MENKIMKTTEQINQIKTLKHLIADMVANHKATKKQEGWSSTYREERKPLFVAYTTYHILRHEIENTDEYLNSVLENMREENQKRYYHLGFFGYEAQKQTKFFPFTYSDLKDAVNACITCLNKYIEEHKENGNE